MPKTKIEKQKVVEALVDSLKAQKGMIFVDIRGLRVKELGILRGGLKEAGTRLMVVKKTLFEKACKTIGLDLKVKNLEGEIAAVFAPEELMSSAKAVTLFAKSHGAMKIRGGYFENSFQEPDIIQELAFLPSREELLGSLVGGHSAVLRGFLNVMEGNLKGLFTVLTNLQAK